MLSVVQDIWVKSNWSVEALANQSVEYRLLQTRGGLSFGLGRLVAKSVNGELSVMIEVAVTATEPLHRLPLSQVEVDAIKSAPARLGVGFTCYVQP